MSDEARSLSDQSFQHRMKICAAQCLAGITPYPDQQWMEQQARNVTMKDWGFLAHSRYLLHDRDGKFCPGFRKLMQAGKVKPPEVAGPQSEPECVCRAVG